MAAFQAIEGANKNRLEGIFGDAAWTNKSRLPDRLLKDLMEHFSSLTLSLENCPEDELGMGYEYLIKKFADDSGHTAQEFYTNRTVVRLMTEILGPKPGESIYDPTCGSAGMLISAAAYLKAQGVPGRSVRLYGQEINSLTASIARMNLFIHGIGDFEIANEDTLRNPAFLVDGRLRQFDLVLANPPYSIRQWDREEFAKDRFGRNFLGVPPQSRADYAFLQHILKSMMPGSGRCAVLLPHGVLFRKEEAKMRENLVRSDLVDCIIGLGPNLFYNSPMESCIMICRTAKPKARRGRILFINAVHEVSRKSAQSFLEEGHIQKIVQAYRSYETEGAFSRVGSLEEVEKNLFTLSIPLYTGDPAERPPEDTRTVQEHYACWDRSGRILREEYRRISVLLSRGGVRNG